MTSYLDPRNLEEAMRELRSLRQRVRDLEVENECLSASCKACGEQLSAIKGKQKPVAWTRVERDCCDEYFNAIIWASDTDGIKPDGEGWEGMFFHPVPSYS